MLFKTFTTLVIILISFPGILISQDKKPIDHSVYDDWKDIRNPVISNDGNYVAYEINPQKGDGELHLYNANMKKDEIFERGTKPVVNSGSNFIAFKIKPQFDTVRAKKLDKVKKDDLPKDSLGIFVFEGKKKIKYPNLMSFKIPKEESDWISFLQEMPKEKTRSGDTTGVEKKEKKKKTKKNDKQYRLNVMNPVSGDSISFDNVTHYAFSKNGLVCSFIQVKKDSIDSVFISAYETKKQQTNLLYKSEGYSENIAMDWKGKQLAFTYSSDTAKVKAFSLYYIDLKNGKPILIPNDEIEKAFPDWTVSQHGKIYFNKNGDELYFGNAPRPEPELKDTLTKDEKVSVDIWNWKDPLLQPHQLKQLKKEQKRSYSVVYFPVEKRAVQLGSEDIEKVVIDSLTKGKFSLGYNNKPYRKMLSWDGSRYSDVYLFERESGENKLAIEKVASTVSLSPNQNFVTWYNIADSSWWGYEVTSGNNINLTKNTGINFYNEWNDEPNEASPYGFGGWTENEEFIVYDRYDLWLIDPSGKVKPEMLTNKEGRKQKVRFRYKKLDKEERVLPDIILLSAFNDVNKQAGYFMLDMKKRDLKQLEFSDHYFSKILKAKNSDQIIWSRESFVQFPDLYYSGMDFNNPTKLTDANPQQGEYNWGITELVDWTTFNGDTMQGILVKPENFDPAKKYPMLVYFYERSTNRLNRYYTPKPIRSTINWTYYASNEYIVFIPDIKYKTGYPGPSAYDCIVSGTQAMCDRYSFIDRNNLGIQGQSWGGYQTAYIITQTDMYKAAMAGAPVSNMTSAYGGIRWGTGLSRAFQYEETQSRIGATLWERRDLYILNSPLFFADQINTPLLMMHNDKDGAVPWYQGIEFFNALRRLKKPVWMLVYNKAPHNLKRRADMEDLTIRMQQFFDHYLKGAAEPVWMKSGVPAIKKGKEYGFELD